MNDKELIEKCYTYARLALPLMSEHGIPVTPRNYAVWYEYVSGNEEVLKTLNAMIEKGEKFPEERNEVLYKRFCSEKDENELRKFREEIQQVMVTMLAEVAALSGETEKYGSSVSNSMEHLSEDASVEEIKKVMNKIIVESKSIGTYGKTLQAKLNESAEELKALQGELDHSKAEAAVDFLTGLANRKAFNETLVICSGQATSDHQDLCLLLFDIDHFKRFNDTYGHITGDDVLKFVGRKIKEKVKGTDFLARYGGEEFAVILPQTPLAGAKIVAENVRAFFAQTKLKAVGTSKPLGTLTVSIGVACYRPGEPLEDFIHRSDQALYFAKNSGRNRVATEIDLSNQEITTPTV